MDVISLINMKGGVGKSTTAHNLLLQASSYEETVAGGGARGERDTGYKARAMEGV